MEDKLKVSTKNDVEIVNQVRKWYKEGKEKSSAWREEARENYNFVAGHQWDEVDIQKLQRESRPTITFNWLSPMIAAVLGLESNQRNETVFKPREINDQGLTDALNTYANLLRDVVAVDEEEAEIFEDTVITGMGWSETRMDYDDDLDGKFVQERVPCLDMYWDSSSRRKNLQDRRWQIYARRMPKEEIIDIWPDAQIVMDAMEDPINTVTVVDASDRYNDKGDRVRSEKENLPLVLHCQWYEKTPLYRVQDPTNGKISDFEPEEYGKVKVEIESLGAKVLKQQKKVYHQAFVCGDQLLEHTLAPSQRNFTFTCSTGKRDHIENMWYGLVRPMKDPQRWSNKFFAQIMDIMSSNAKGGLMAEEGAFTDPKKAEEDWAKSDSIIYLKPGAIAGGKIQVKPVAQYPQGLDRMMTFAVDAIRGVSGINLELLGLADRQQAGIVENSRKTSAFTILSKMFESLSNYRRLSALLMLDFIRNFIPQGKIARALSEKELPYVDAIKNIDVEQTDIVVSEAPQSENNKAIVWQFISQILPMVVKAGMPIPPSILDYSPLPEAVAKEWKDMLMAAMAPPPPPPGMPPQQGMPPQGPPQGPPMPPNVVPMGA